MRPSPELRSGDGSDSVYEEYGAVDIDELNVDVREISEENENDDDEYEEYDREYEQYRTSESESAAPRFTKKKMWAIFLVVIIAGLVDGLPIHFTKTRISTNSTTTAVTIMTTESPIKKSILLLSTYDASNVPMVIGLNGKSTLTTYV